MNLQTQIPLNSQEPKIDYSSKVLLLGSCFTENMGGKLNYFKFQNTQNPFGIIFNPVSIKQLVLRALKDDFFSEKDIFQHNSLWHCFEVHSSLSAVDKSEFLEQLNLRLKTFKKALLEASHMVITLGSAWVYRFKASKEIVANCHKVPQKEFTKELLSIEAISESLQNLISEIQKGNKNATFIITVSPVRHLKDGFPGNTWSKANLIAGTHKIIEMSLRAQSRSLHYFPSYELMMDELRDYRFYAKDMLHPNEIAVDYIWEKFKEVWISKDTEAFQKEIDTIQKGLLHKPFNLNSLAYLKFKEGLTTKIENLRKNFPNMEF
ncbi:MAG: GSCFA domain-containing protein [Flavobacteriaceae bacterium]